MKILHMWYILPDSYQSHNQNLNPTMKSVIQRWKKIHCRIKEDCRLSVTLWKFNQWNWWMIKTTRTPILIHGSLETIVVFSIMGCYWNTLHQYIKSTGSFRFDFIYILYRHMSKLWIINKWIIHLTQLGTRACRYIKNYIMKRG